MIVGACHDNYPGQEMSREHNQSAHWSLGRLDSEVSAALSAAASTDISCLENIFLKMINCSPITLEKEYVYFSK